MVKFLLLDDSASGSTGIGTKIIVITGTNWCHAHAQVMSESAASASTAPGQ